MTLALSATSARAQVDEAESAYKEGVALRKASKDEAALAKFKASWDLGKAPKARAQMALAEQALGRWADAETHLVEALGAKNDSWIENQRKTLEESLAQIGAHLGKLEVVGGVDGSELFLNGTRIGALPMDKPARVEAGTWMLEVKKPDYYPVSKSVIVPPNGLARVTVEMKLFKVEPATPPPEPAPPATVAPPVQQQTPPPAASPRAPEAPPTTTSQTLGWVAVGTGAAAAAFGVVALTRRNHYAGEFNDDPRCGTSVASPTPSCIAAREGASTWQTLSAFGFVAGGLLVGTGVVLFAASPSTTSKSSSPTAGRESSTTSLVCGAGPGHVGVSCTVRF